MQNNHTTGNTWIVPASDNSLRTTNPIRAIVDKIDISKINTEKSLLRLSIGDPTIYGNFKIPQEAQNAVENQLLSYKANGYPPSTGYSATKLAIAKYFTLPIAPLVESDVIVTSGCSGAIEICIGVLANPGQNILMPRPGFSLYQTVCESKNISFKYYNLLADRQWEIDLDHLDSLIDEKTAAIIVNNPSNPCGCVYSKEHLIELTKIAERHRIPIIADEIYGGILFEGEFHSVASVTTTVPVLSVGGIAKQFMAPGWRLGWILIHDRNNTFQKVREGILRLSQVILGANSLIQAALPEILQQTPKEYYDSNSKILLENANFSYERLTKIKGLTVVKPKATLYLMVGIDITQFNGIKDDVDFSQKLLQEESVFVLPAQCFKISNYIRIVFCPPKEQLTEAYDRIENFCKRYYKI